MTIPSEPSSVYFGWSIHSVVRILHSTLSISTYFVTAGIGFSYRNLHDQELLVLLVSLSAWGFLGSV